MYANLKKRQEVTANKFLLQYMAGELSEIRDSTVTTLPSGLMSGLGVSNIYFPNCETIDACAMSGCYTLQIVSFPKCKTIGSSAFLYTGNTWGKYLKLTFPLCEEIGNMAFAMTNFQEVQLPKVKKIPFAAFSYASSMQKFYGPNVEEVGSAAFYYCYGLKSIVMPKLKTIRGMSAFYGCSGSRVFTLNTVEEIIDSPWCFSGMGYYVDKINLNNLRLISNSPGIFSDSYSMAELELPKLETINIGGSFGPSSPFYYNYGIKKLSVPKLNAGSGYFKSMRNLISIYFKPSSRINVGYEAFMNCTSLTTLLNVGPTDLYSIDDRAFYRCASLKNIQLNGAYSIGVEAFAQCGLEAVEFDGLYSLGSEAFYNCPSLRTVKGFIYNGLPDRAFNACGLTTVSLRGCNDLGWACFEGCTGLEFADLSNCYTLGEATFKNCYSLKYVNLPAVKVVSAEAFGFCSQLETIELPSLKEIHRGAFGFL